MVNSVRTAKEKLSKPCRKLLQMRPNLKAQYKKRKSSIARALLDYLTADSFMYGPLLSPPPPKRSTLSPNGGAHDRFPPSGGTHAHDRFPPSGGAHDMFPRRNSPLSHNEDAGGSMVTSSNTPSTPSSAIRRMSTFTKKFLWRSTPNNEENGNEVAAPMASEVLHKYFEEPFVRTPFEDHDKVVGENEGNGDGNLTDEAGDDDESSKSFTESQTENDVTPLHKEASMEVARRLVRKVGGRFSKELGIFVDIRDSEAERWFLATTFLGHPSEFEPAKQMFKKLQVMGISKIQDVLGIDQSELEEAFQQVMHNHRIASRLQKIAFGLHSLHGGGICTLKRIANYGELKRDLESIPGYSRNAARIFLREMRGVWPGASPEFEIRTRNAAKHLHLLSSIKEGGEATSDLVEIAQDSGLDERDLEVALVKLSFQHGRQYRSCPGGRECEFARITLSDLDHLIVNL